MLVALAAVALIYVGVGAAMFAFQRSLIYYPQPRAVTAPEATMVLSVDEARLVVTTRERPGPKAVLYFGGNAEDVSQNLASFSQTFPDHALYLLHYRSYGGSTGRPSEAANHADALALFDAVRAQHADIAVIGRSLGSGVAIRVAHERTVSRLVLVTPYDSVEALAAEAYPALPVRLLLLDRYESTRYAPDIRVPTTLVVAERDVEIPRANSDRLQARFAPGIASRVVIPGAGHNDLGARAEYRAALAQAVR